MRRGLVWQKNQRPGPTMTQGQTSRCPKSAAGLAEQIPSSFCSRAHFPRTRNGLDVQASRAGERVVTESTRALGSRASRSQCVVFCYATQPIPVSASGTLHSYCRSHVLHAGNDTPRPPRGLSMLCGHYCIHESVGTPCPFNVRRKPGPALRPDAKGEPPNGNTKSTMKTVTPSPESILWRRCGDARARPRKRQTTFPARGRPPTSWCKGCK